MGWESVEKRVIICGSLDNHGGVHQKIDQAIWQAFEIEIDRVVNDTLRQWSTRFRDPERFYRVD